MFKKLRHPVRIIALFALVLSLVLFAQQAKAQNSIAQNTSLCSQLSINEGITILNNAKINSIKSDRPSNTVQCEGANPKIQEILIDDQELQSSIQNFDRGDRVNLEYSDNKVLQSLFVPAINRFSCTYNSTDAGITLGNATIESISQDRSVIQVQCQQQQNIISVKDPGIKTALESFSSGDHVDLEYNTSGLQNISIRSYEITLFNRLLAIAIAVSICLLISVILLWGEWRNLIVGADNRYSNSKFQVALWFFILIVTYLASIALRGWYGGFNFFGGINIPQNLLLLSGLSALTFVAAKGITQNKIDNKREQKLPPPTTETSESELRQWWFFFRDLSHDDQNRVDFGDFQMIVITIIAVVTYILGILGFLSTIALYKVVTLPDVDGTILAVFGLGQGAYLGKKFISDVGGGKPQPSTRPPVKPPVQPSADPLGEDPNEANIGILGAPNPPEHGR